MNIIESLHKQAMELCDKADALRKAGNHAESLRLFKEAHALELKVAEFTDCLPEPTCSIIRKSLAAIAKDCQDTEALA